MDYYKIFNINKSASEEEVKKLFGSWRINIIRIKVAETTRNLKKSTKRIRFCPIKKSGNSTTNLAGFFSAKADRPAPADLIPSAVFLKAVLLAK